MILSFGHIHPDDLGLPPMSAVGGDQAAVVVAHTSTGTADQDRHQLPDDDYCPICASMALVATAIASLPPTLIVPIPVRYAWPARADVPGVRPSLTPSFQARGPPVI